MSYAIHMDQQDLLNRAEAHMLSLGYSVESRTPVSINFARTPPMGCGVQLAILLLTITTAGLFLLAIPLFFMMKWRGSITAIETDGSDGPLQVTVGGHAATSREEIQRWLEEEIASPPACSKPA